MRTSRSRMGTMPETVAREISDSRGTYFVVMESASGLYDGDEAQRTGRWLKCERPVAVRQ